VAPILRPSPVTVAEGLVLSSVTFALLQKRQAKKLAPAKAKLDAWISKLPPMSFLGPKTFRVTGGGNRYDIDSYGCTPNFVS
jgi:hypothetical protein